MSNIVVEIKDYGIGIPKKEQKKVFERFFRGDNARKKAIKGTGLGLALTQKIIQAHGGKIRLTSEPGKGSTFTVILQVHSIGGTDEKSKNFSHRR